MARNKIHYQMGGVPLNTEVIQFTPQQFFKLSPSIALLLTCVVNCKHSYVAIFVCRLLFLGDDYNSA